MKHKLQAIYHRLFAHFGPQHWWPADTPFEVMVGAILTQNTNWLNVEKAINNLKAAGLLAPDKMRRLNSKRLAELILPAGYYNIKAKRLKNFLSFFCCFYGGDSLRMARVETKSLRNQLLGVQGIGPETADSILLYALKKPIFVIDAYTKRILSRHCLLKPQVSYKEAQDLFMCNLKRNEKLFNEYHALMVKLGKEFCLKSKPKCKICPLKTR